MIHSDDELKRTNEYIAGLEHLLLEMRRTHTPEQYAFFSKGWIRKIQAAQTEVVDYLMESAPPQEAPASERQAA